MNEVRENKRQLFGTDGIRGEANSFPMISEVALELGRALTYFIKKKKDKPIPKIIIGKDTRLSGYMIETALCSGIVSMGGYVYLCGPMPTPGISFLSSNMRVDAGIVISASHNPYKDNGIKIFSGDGFKLPDSEEAEIESLMWSDLLKQNYAEGVNIGKSFKIDDARGRYIVGLKNTFPKEITLDGIKIALDCANGASYKIAPSVFEELGAKVFATGVKPDGININQECGSLYPEKVRALVLESGADIGISLDGDADRVIIVDEKGNILDGDILMAICASRMIREGRLNHNTLVATIMSNIGLEKAIARMGGRLIRTNVGDRYVVEEMRRGNFNFGGEQSGHLIFLEHASTGDGIVASLQILAIMIKENKRLSELTGIMERYPQALVSVKVEKKIPFEELSNSMRLYKEIERTLGSEGRIVVRYSGTEPKVRVMIEGEDEDMVKNFAQELANTIQKEIENKIRG